MGVPVAAVVVVVVVVAVVVTPSTLPMRRTTKQKFRPQCTEIFRAHKMQTLLIKGSESTTVQRATT
jgi:hypothetical protein